MDRNAECIATLGEEGIFLLADDVIAPTALDEATAIAARQAGHLDLVGKDAGLARRPAIEASVVGEFERVHAVPLLASVCRIRSVVPHVRPQGSGRIIKVISLAAEACQLNSSAYSSLKGVRWALSRWAAGELGSSGFLVNCLIPDLTNTRIWSRPRPELQDPQCAHLATALSTLLQGGTAEWVLWDLAGYPLFSRTFGTGSEVVR
jgi:NAD(P)-dependent dehydrogenase (short-subunit alcohol dehydrogenase family)